MEKIVLDLDVLSTHKKFEDAIAKVESKASKNYQARINKLFEENKITDEQYFYYMDEHENLRNRVLEEIDPKYKNRINFYEIFEVNEEMRDLVASINKMSENKELFIQFYYSTEREKNIKINICKRLFPNCKEIIPIKYYQQEYSSNIRRKRTNKTTFIKEKLGVTNLEGYTLIDKASIGVGKPTLTQFEWGNSKGQYLIVDYSNEIKKFYLRPPKVLVLDYDDVLYPSKEIMEKILAEIDEKATEAYMKKIVAEKGDSDDFSELRVEHYNVKNMILEDVGEFKGLVDYVKAYSLDFYENAINYLIYYLTCGIYDFVVIESHYNSEDELKIKFKKLNDAIEAKKKKLGLHIKMANLMMIGVRFFEQEFDPNIIRIPTSKFDRFVDKTGIKDTSLVTLVDDREKNVEDWIEKGGHAILFVNGEKDIKNYRLNSLNPFDLKMIEIQRLSRIPALPATEEEKQKKNVKK